MLLPTWLLCEVLLNGRAQKNGFPGDLEPKLATERGTWGTIMFREHPCVILHALGVRHPGIGVNCPGCDAPWDLPWVVSGRFPLIMIRKPVAGATPLEGPGTSGASLPPEPWGEGFPLGYNGSIERPLTSEGPIQSSPDPQGSGDARVGFMSRPTQFLLFESREVTHVRMSPYACGAKVRWHPWG